MPALLAVIGANADPMRRELKAVEAMSATAGNRIRVNLEAGGAMRSGSIREIAVLMREISRGNWTRVPGFGIHPHAAAWPVEIYSNPIAGILLGIGAAIFFVVRHLNEVATQQRNLAELLDTATVKFSDQARAMKRAAEEAASFKSWLDDLKQSEEGLGEVVEENLRIMRERYRLQREIASEGGAGKNQLEQMDVEQMRRELQAVQAGLVQAQRNAAAHGAEATQAEAAAKDTSRVTHLENVSSHAKQIAEIIDELKKDVATQRTAVATPFSATTSGLPGISYSSRPANETDKFLVGPKGAEIFTSLKDMQAAFDKRCSVKKTSFSPIKGHWMTPLDRRNLSPKKTWRTKSA